MFKIQNRNSVLVVGTAFAFVSAATPLLLLAIGISVSPIAISLETVSGMEKSVKFTVSNPSREVGLFEVYPEEFERNITLIPSRFLLESGERREILVRLRHKETGTFKTNIAVEVKPLGELLLGVGGGVRLPFSFTVLEPRGAGLLAGAFASRQGDSLIVTGTVLLLLFAYKKDAARVLRTMCRLIRRKVP